MNIFSSNFLEGQTFLITGASSGIGQAVSVLIARFGGRVIASGRNEERLNLLLERLAPGNHCKCIFDMQNADEVSEWVKGLAGQFGPFSGIFHSAGVELVRPVRMTKQANLDEIFSGTLFSAFGIARASAQKNAVIDGGSIVFMSSVAGSHGQLGMTAYSAVKAGVEGLVKSLSCELAPRKIRVNSIAAGAVKTAMHDRLTGASGDVATNEYEKAHLLGFGSPDDVASAAIFLLCSASSWITGTTMLVDGGYSVR